MAKSGQNVSSDCHLDHFSLKMATTGDLFFCCILSWFGTCNFFCPFPDHCQDKPVIFLSQRFRPHFFRIFFRNFPHFSAFSAFISSGSDRIPPPECCHKLWRWLVKQLQFFPDYLMASEIIQNLSEVHQKHNLPKALPPTGPMLKC